MNDGAAMNPSNEMWGLGGHSCVRRWLLMTSDDEARRAWRVRAGGWMEDAGEGRGWEPTAIALHAGAWLAKLSEAGRYSMLCDPEGEFSSSIGLTCFVRCVSVRVSGLQ